MIDKKVVEEGVNLEFLILELVKDVVNNCCLGLCLLLIVYVLKEMVVMVDKDKVVNVFYYLISNV